MAASVRCKTIGSSPKSAHRTSIHRINLQGRNFPLPSPTPGLSNKRIRSRLRAIYPYSLGIKVDAEINAIRDKDWHEGFPLVNEMDRSRSRESLLDQATRSR